MSFEIIICKSGKEGGCGSADANPEDLARFEERQRQLGNTVVGRTFCNQEMCGPRDVFKEALDELNTLFGTKQLTGILVSGTTEKGVVHDRAPGVVSKDSLGKITSTILRK